jgi:FAD/FMN-containing dehydrogenase
LPWPRPQASFGESGRDHGESLASADRVVRRRRGGRVARCAGVVSRRGDRGGAIGDAVLAQSSEQAKRLWALRENIGEAQKIEGLSIKHDVSLPISRLPEFVERADRALALAFPEIRIVTFGHLGDGNLHYNQSKSEAFANAAFLAVQPEVNAIVYDLVQELGGSISAEHGIGQLKREELLRHKSPVEMALMRALKRTLDPQGLMNPGKVL